MEGSKNTKLLVDLGDKKKVFETHCKAMHSDMNKRIRVLIDRDLKNGKD